MNAENSSLRQMSTNEVLDLLELSPVTTQPTVTGAVNASDRPASAGRGLQSLLNNIGDLWGAEEYEQEYDLDEFLDQIT